jgi:general secretion pathway protein G
MHDTNFLHTVLIWAQSQKHARAFTLVELLIIVAILGTLSAIAVPVYSNYVIDSKNAAAIVDVRRLESEIEKFRVQNGRFPNSLAETGLPTQLDPWGRPYGYLRIEGVVPPPAGEWRKDKSMNPLNADYDLYSIGNDGITKKELSGHGAGDDIVRANNGVYVGLGSEY